MYFSHLIFCLLNARHVLRPLKGTHWMLQNIFTHFIPLCWQWEKTFFSHWIHSLQGKIHCRVDASFCLPRKMYLNHKRRKREVQWRVFFHKLVSGERAQHGHGFLITATRVHGLILLRDTLTLLPVSEEWLDGRPSCSLNRETAPGERTGNPAAYAVLRRHEADCQRHGLSGFTGAAGLGSLLQTSERPGVTDEQEL